MGTEVVVPPRPGAWPGMKWVCFFILWSVLGLAPSACAKWPQVVISTRQGTVAVDVELAATRATRTLGLMFRDKLGANRGMLFIFAKSQEHPFWMKNTKLALDIVFISEGLEVVGVIENARSFSSQTLSIGRPSRFALEVPAGFCAERGVKAGDRVFFRGFDLAAIQVDPE